MNCDTELLQTFLDGELESTEAEAVRRHLGCCPACRQELSRLRLLWLELEKEENAEVPFELPFIRQQIIAGAREAIKENEESPGVSYWEAQKLAWQPVLTGVVQIPGPRQLSRLARVTGRGLPAVLRGVSAVTGMMFGRKRDRR